jgi:hypothetical protein
MDNEQIGSLALKILAIYAVVLLINTIPTMTWVISGGFLEAQFSLAATLQKWVLLFPLFALLVLVLVMVMYSQQLGRYLVDSDSEITPAPNEDTVWKQSLAFSVVGVILIVSSLPDLMVWIFTKLYGGRYTPESIYRLSWPEFATHLLKLLFGLVLFLGAKSLAETWKKFKDNTRPMKEQ